MSLDVRRIALALVSFLMLVTSALSSCSGGDAGLDDGGALVGPPATTDAPVTSDVAVVFPRTDAAQPAADATNCTPFSPPIPCAQGTSCPQGSYCDTAQSPPVCAKLYCCPNGVACDDGKSGCTGKSSWSPANSCPGNEYCMSGLCLAGVCASPVGEGADCSKQFCAQGLRCLPYPYTCVRQSPVGGACKSDAWCLKGVEQGPGFAGPDETFCLGGACGHNHCLSTAASISCHSGSDCAPGNDCLNSGGSGFCVQLYCGTDGVPCGKDTHCASGYGCVSNRCRKLNVPLHCAGTPIADDCTTSSTDFPYPGCVVGSTGCTGTPFDCSVHKYETSGISPCVGESGCVWDAASQTCVGTPTPCAQILGTSSYCQPITGCLAHLTVTGTPMPCAQIANDQCRWQPGCAFTDVGVY
jgi:hypothetical protein